jgi:hypothetical protein
VNPALDWLASVLRARAAAVRAARAAYRGKLRREMLRCCER